MPTARAAVPSVPIATARAPVWPPAAKLPVWATSTFTVMLPGGAGLAVRVKLAAPPSVTAGPAATPTTGVSGGGSSLSVMVSVWTLGVPTVYPVPPVSVRTTVSAPSSAPSSVIATGMSTLAASAAAAALPEFAMVKSPAVAVPPTV